MNGTTHTELLTLPWATSLLYLNGGRRGVVGSGIRADGADRLHTDLRRPRIMVPLVMIVLQ